MENKIDKGLLSFYEDLELEELESLSEYPEEIETGCPPWCDSCVEEHLKVINYLIKENYGN